MKAGMKIHCENCGGEEFHLILDDPFLNRGNYNDVILIRCANCFWVKGSTNRLLINWKQ